MLLLFFVLGFFSLLSQTLILREFIISFGGSELAIGLFYFFWFFWVGLGSLAVLTKIGGFGHKHFLKIIFLYPLLAFLEIILFISLRKLAHIPWWEFFSWGKAVICLFGITSLISFFTGVLFTAAVLWLKRVKEEENICAVITAGYVWESLGSFAAGCVGTVLIIKLAPPALILLYGSIVFCAAGVLGSIFFKEKISTGLGAALLFIFIIGVFMPQKSVGFFDNLRLNSIFGEGEFIKQVYTPYQHLLLTRLKDEIIVIANGEVISKLPEEFDADKESAVFMAQAPFARNILVFGAAAQNLVAALLKFDIETVTYCWEDEVSYRAIYDQSPLSLRQALDDKRLKVEFKSARVFLRQNLPGTAYPDKNKFDLVIVYVSDPSNLFLNTFFTKEFYSLVESRLEPRGILAAQITSAENFIGEELCNYGSAVYYTLKEVFPKIVITAGTTNWFLAGGERSLLSEDAAVLEQRFKTIKPEASSFPAQGFSSLFLKDKIDFVKRMYIDNSLFKKTKLVNSDDKPLAFFLEILVMARYSQTALAKFFKSALFVGIAIFIAPFLILLAVRIWFIARCENSINKNRIFNAKLYQFLSGFLGFSFHLCLIFLFQNRFGTIAGLIGLVNALFMLGLCAGGIFGKYKIDRVPASGVVRKTLGAQILFIIAGYLIFTLAPAVPSLLIFMVFLAFFLAAGILTGMSYPLASKLLQDNAAALVKTTVSLELLDYWGASCAGILAGLFMLPLLGVFQSMLFLSIMAGLLFFVFSMEFLPLKIFREERTPANLSLPYIRAFYSLIAVSLCFLVISYLVERKKAVWQTAYQRETEEKQCQRQSKPFPAYVCQTKEGREYILESKDYASNIKGFNGPINLKISLSSDYRIKTVKIIEHQETTRYIENIDKFLSQFSGRGLGCPFDDVDTISGATITSGAIIEIVNAVRGKILKEGSAGESPIVKVDWAGMYLILFSTIAVVLYAFFPAAIFWRKIYLLFVVVILGCIFNAVFSLAHLANLLTFNISGSRVLSQVLIYAIPLFLGLLLGQFWCGWLCSFGALQELLGSSRLCCRPASAADKKARFFKYIFLAFIIIVIAGNRNADFFSREPLSVFFSHPLRFSSDKTLALAALLFSVFFPRFWCRYFCPCAAFLSLFNKAALLRRSFTKKYNNCPYGVTAAYDIDCIQCNICCGPGIRNKRAKFFKLAFFTMLILMLSVFSSNLAVRKQQDSRQKTGSSTFGFQRIDYARIKKLIAEDKLSDKEALFYRMITN